MMLLKKINFYFYLNVILNQINKILIYLYKICLIVILKKKKIDTHKTFI